MDEMLEKNREKAEKRKVDIRKARRKKRLAKELNKTEQYKSLHQYSKNSINISREEKTDLSISDKRKLERMKGDKNGEIQEDEED